MEVVEVDFLPEHAQELQQHLEPDDLRRDPDYCAQIADQDSAWSFMRNGHLLFCCGIYPVWPGVGEAWFLPSEDLKKYKKSVVKFVLSKINMRAKEYNLKRIHATINAGIETDARFAQFLGFKIEGRMRNYGLKGEDYYMMARYF